MLANYGSTFDITCVYEADNRTERKLKLMMLLQGDIKHSLLFIILLGYNNVRMLSIEWLGASVMNCRILGCGKQAVFVNLQLSLTLLYCL